METGGIFGVTAEGGIFNFHVYGRKGNKTCDECPFLEGLLYISSLQVEAVFVFFVMIDDV